MIILKIIFLIFILSLVISLIVKMLTDEDVCRKIAYTIINIALILMWLFILII